MRLRSLLPATLVLVAFVACRDASAPRPVTVFPSPSSDAAGTRPLSSRGDPEQDVRPVLPTPRPAPGLTQGVPDPAEPGISDLARLARYVFREMGRGEGVCAFANPLHDPLSFALHVEVQGGRTSDVHLAWAGVRQGEELQRLQTPPPELQAYVECLAPRLEAVAMDPAPADGAYQPEYSYPGHRDGL